MPLHDWTRVGAGIFHHFHHRWISAISDALNDDRLPAPYYALAEQVAGLFGPDVLTLEATEPEHARIQATLVIRHSSGDRIIALVEIVSPGNKASQHAVRTFVEKAANILDRGYHLLILDLQPPSPRDPNGIHGALSEELGDAAYQQPSDRPLTLASYDAGPPPTAYVEPVAVGQTLPDIPLFLRPGNYISVPLEVTYQTAWEKVPQRWRRVLETPS